VTSGGRCGCHLHLGVCIFSTVQLMTYALVMGLFERDMFPRYFPKLDVTCAHILISKVLYNNQNKTYTSKLSH
jgi:hypothetical protein